MEGSVSPKSNKLLELLPADEYALVQPGLELTHLPQGTIVHEPGQALRYAVFPISGLIGRVASTSDGKSVELTLSSREGMIGTSIFLGGKPLGARAAVLVDTVAFRLPAPLLLSAWRQCGPLQIVLLRYLQSMMREIIQVALCNKHHSVEQQLSRWLLVASDRLGRPSLSVTQSIISNMLGVRREGITEAAGRLEAEHVIRRERGGMTIIDRGALARKSCECSTMIIGAFDRMMNDTNNGRSPAQAK